MKSWHGICLSHANRLLGQRMLQSAQSFPQFSLTIDADAGRLLAAQLDANIAQGKGLESLKAES